MSIDAQTVLISCLPNSDQVGDVSVLIQVSDGTDIQAFQISVEPEPRKLINYN